MDEDAVDVDGGDIGVAGGGDPEILVGVELVDDEGVEVVLAVAGGF